MFFTDCIKVSFWWVQGELYIQLVNLILVLLVSYWGHYWTNSARKYCPAAGRIDTGFLYSWFSLANTRLNPSTHLDSCEICLIVPYSTYAVIKNKKNLSLLDLLWADFFTDGWASLIVLMPSLVFWKRNGSRWTLHALLKLGHGFRVP